ncbi:MAG: hypothetical protein V4658_13700 [Bacteroidota bacterium]
MKALIFSAAFLGSLFSSKAQTISPADSTGLPGDHFSLEGALELFKISQSPEEFEKMLNAEDNKVNNLDLNGDGETDYIKVIDKQEGNAHAFILQAVVSETENQDVAVIELEKKSDDKAVLQIVGDEDVYGQQTIVEPTQKVAVNAGTSTKTVIVNVQPWPVVRYVYTPSYAVWVSPWRWRTYPAWYRPWRPVHYHVFYGYRSPYRYHYTVARRHRVIVAHRAYVPVRTTSVTVRTRNQATMTTYRTNRTTRNVAVPRSRSNVQNAAPRSRATGNNHSHAAPRKAAPPQKARPRN